MRSYADVVRRFRDILLDHAEAVPTGARLSATFVVNVGLAILVFLAFRLRSRLWDFQSNDFTFYLLPWYELFRRHGFAAFHDAFSDYNPPYLFLLYFTSLFKMKPIDAVKTISLCGDLLLSFSVMRVVTGGTTIRYLPRLAAVATLFVPGVFLNSAMWGQCDAFYTAFLLLCFAEVQKSRFISAWVVWTVALTFKLQAIFYLPFLAFLWGHDRRCPFLAPTLVIPVFLAPLVPVWLAGRSWASLLTIYTAQANLQLDRLTYGAPTLYRWIPDKLGSYFASGGVTFAASVITLTLVAFFVYRPVIDAKQRLVFATFLLLLVPFLLPEMHERYFMAAEVFSFTLAFLRPRFAYVALLLQVNVLFSYMPYLGAGIPAVPPDVMALAMLAAICFLAHDLIVSSADITAQPQHHRQGRQSANTTAGG